MESTDTGLKDIPGVGGPIEDPYQRERKRLFADPEIDVPLIKLKSNFNPIPLVQKLMYFSFEYPIDLAYKFFETIRVTKPRRYYHQQFRRVPNIWECATDDYVCIYEAESQFRRDMKVDQEIVDIMQDRVSVCHAREGANHVVKCKEVDELLQKIKFAWHVKYGELGLNCDARRVLNKQKNRFIEDRYLARIGKSHPYGQV